MSKVDKRNENVKISSSKKANEAINTVKCLIIGDEGIGKSSLVRSFISSDDLSSEYTPTTCTEYSVHNQMKDVFGSGTLFKSRLKIIDTGGQWRMDRLRPLFYNKVDVIIICFSVIRPNSFKNITKKWLPEIKLHCSRAQIILVGTQSEHRTNPKILAELAEKNMTSVPEYKIKKLAKKIGAKSYIECSSQKSNSNVKKVFDYSMIWGLHNQILKNKLSEKAANATSEPKILQFLSKEWISRSCSSLKKFMFFSCLFH